MKRCTKCGEEKPKSEFWKRKKYKDGLAYHCKQCAKKENDEYRKKNKKKFLEYGRQYRKNNHEICKKRDLKKIGWSIELWNKKFKEQKGVCAICGKKETEIHPATGKIKPLSADHNHKTKKPRGLLCTFCNVLIGAAKEKESTLLSAIEYLKKYNE